MDHHLPRYHVRPPRGFLNDPNGPIVIDGVVHLYFQYRQTTDTAEPVLWGHATSPDLAHWTLHRPAMAPRPGGLDADGCWSGVTVATQEGIRAFYSGLQEGHPLQSALTALSTDGGASFGPPTQVVPDPEGLVQYRDPFVWREAGQWRLAMGAGTADEVASIRVWKSDDLETWTPAGTLAQLPRTRTDDGVDTGGMWECPQVLDVDGVRVALVGAWSEDGGTMRVLAALPDRGGDRLEGLGLHPIDDGPNLYAPSVLRDGPRGPLVFGWVTEGRAEEWWREDGWAGTISLPRELSLGPGGRMLSAPAPEVEALRRSTVRVAGAETLDGLGAQLEVEASVRGAGGVRLRCGSETLDVRVDAEGTATIDRSHASLDPRADAEDVVVPGAGADEETRLRLFVDGSVLELFTATGRVATARFYPTTSPPWSLETLGDVDVEVHALG